jgi:hypothetical protein
MRRLVLLLFLAATLNHTTPASGAQYTFSRIYTGAVLPGIAVNDNGLVALCDGTSLLTTDGHTSTVIAGPAGPNYWYYSGTQSPQLFSLNNNGVVVFHGAVSGTAALLASNGITTTTIAADSPVGLFFHTAISGAATINDSGMVAFWNAKNPPFPATGIFYGNGATPVAVPNTYYTTGAAINNAGEIAYCDFSTSSFTLNVWNGTQVFSLPAGPGRPDINDAGTAIGWLPNNTPGNDRIVLWNGTAAPVYIDGSSYWHFGSGYVFDGVDEATFAINNQGLAAFYAYPTALTNPAQQVFTGGIFTGPDPVSNKVIAAGDLLSGATVSTVTFYRGGLNNNGQIAFTATLSDGTQGVWVATPTPPFPGDANYDGTVNGADLNIVLSNYNQTSMTWAQGDFNGDGTVNGTDLNTVLSNYNQVDPVTAAVPEPSAFVLLGIGVISILGYTRRRLVA